jgi:dephospho-CoA kinase
VRIIGLTGGIGSGKSTVARMLAELGAEVIDADLVGHEVYRPGTTGWERLTEAFGREIVAPDGSIDRKTLGGIVFADPTALKRLNRIVHPLISEAIQARLAARRAAGSTRPIVVEAAVLIEANWVTLVDEVWVVTAGPDAVLARVQAQRGLSAEAIAARMAAQLSDETRRAHADLVIENSGSLEALRAAVARAWERATTGGR